MRARARLERRQRRTLFRTRTLAIGFCGLFLLALFLLERNRQVREKLATRNLDLQTATANIEQQRDLARRAQRESARYSRTALSMILAARAGDHDRRGLREEAMHLALGSLKVEKNQEAAEVARRVLSHLPRTTSLGVITGAAFSPSGTRLAALYKDRVDVLDVRGWPPRLISHVQPTGEEVVFCGNDRLVVRSNRGVAIYDFSGGDPTPLEVSANPELVAADDQGQFVACWTGDGTLRVFDAVNGQIRHGAMVPHLDALFFSRSGLSLVAVDSQFFGPLKALRWSTRDWQHPPSRWQTQQTVRQNSLNRNLRYAYLEKQGFSVDGLLNPGSRKRTYSGSYSRFYWWARPLGNGQLVIRTPLGVILRSERLERFDIPVVGEVEIGRSVVGIGGGGKARFLSSETAEKAVYLKGLVTTLPGPRDRRAVAMGKRALLVDLMRDQEAWSIATDTPWGDVGIMGDRVLIARADHSVASYSTGGDGLIGPAVTVQNHIHGEIRRIRGDSLWIKQGMRVVVSRIDSSESILVPQVRTIDKTVPDASGQFIGYLREGHLWLLDRSSGETVRGPEIPPESTAELIVGRDREVFLVHRRKVEDFMGEKIVYDVALTSFAGHLVRRFTFPSQPASILAAANARRYVIVAAGIEIWTEGPTPKLDSVPGVFATHAFISADGRRIAAASGNEAIIIDADSAWEILRFKARKRIRGVGILADRWLVGWTQDQILGWPVDLPDLVDEAENRLGGRASLGSATISEVLTGDGRFDPVDVERLIR